MPVSSSDLRSLSTHGHPPPPAPGWSSASPLVRAASLGAPVRSWVTVSRVTPSVSTRLVGQPCEALGLEAVVHEHPPGLHEAPPGIGLDHLTVDDRPGDAVLLHPEPAVVTNGLPACRSDCTNPP